MHSQIITAFSNMDIPQGRLSVDTYDDEETNVYFTGTSWEEHEIAKLRDMYSAITFFTPEAFRYYLPAFMLAELNDPETADIIAENLASKFVGFTSEELLNIKFNNDQLIAIKCFFDYCAQLYDDEYFDDFQKAAHKVSLVLNRS